MTESPLISIVIPVYNAESYILETVESALRQTYKNTEIIIIDDSSTDNSYKIIEGLKAKHNRINILRIEHAGRPSVPRNLGISKAKGEYIAFLDGDDIWTTNKLEEQIQYIQEDNRIGLVYSVSKTIGASIFSPQYEILPLPGKGAETMDDLINKGNSITCSSVLARSEVLREVNGFDEDPELKIEDYDLWIRISAKYKIKFIPRLHVYYRVHPGQFSADWKIKQERLAYLAKKRKWNIPPYKYYRTKGLFLRLLRNAVHVSALIWLKTAAAVKR